MARLTASGSLSITRGSVATGPLTRRVVAASIQLATRRIGHAVIQDETRSELPDFPRAPARLSSGEKFRYHFCEEPGSRVRDPTRRFVEDGTPLDPYRNAAIRWKQQRFPKEE